MKQIHLTNKVKFKKYHLSYHLEQLWSNKTYQTVDMKSFKNFYFLNLAIVLTKREIIRARAP